MDTDSNYLPLKFDHIHASAYDLDTNRLVGTGDLRGKSFPAKSFPEFQLPLNFTYTASNDTDQTCGFPLYLTSTSQTDFPLFH